MTFPIATHPFGPNERRARYLCASAAATCTKLLAGAHEVIGRTDVRYWHKADMGLAINRKIPRNLYLGD